MTRRSAMTTIALIRTEQEGREEYGHRISAPAAATRPLGCRWRASAPAWPRRAHCRPWRRRRPRSSPSRASRSPATTRWATARRPRVLAPFLRSDATMDTLQKATVALETALRDKGFGLHRVALPPQEVGDTVTLNIVKFSDRQGRVSKAAAFTTKPTSAAPCPSCGRAKAPTSSGWPSRRRSPTRTPTSRSRWGCASPTSRTRSTPPSR